MSPELAEALRNEIRQALDAGGKPFDVVVARRVYDLAIAAKDMCVAATAGVGEAIKTIADNGGPIESLGELEPGAPAVQAQASETFGARILRELIATLKPPPLPLAQDDVHPVELVNAIADARRAGMTDVAEALEVKLLGRALDSNKPIAPVIDVPEGSYQHGFADGKAGLPPTSDTVTYKNGWTQGTTERFLQKPDMINVKHAFEPRVSDRFAGPRDETCEHCGTDPRNTIHEGHEQAVRDAHVENGITIV